MNFKQQYRNSKILFGTSLLFLLLFLVVWLQSVYQDKVEELNTEVSYLWLKSIKEVEGKTFTNMIVTSVSNLLDSTILLPSPGAVVLPNIKNNAPSNNYSFSSSTKKEEVQMIFVDSMVKSSPYCIDSLYTEVTINATAAIDPRIHPSISDSLLFQGRKGLIKILEQFNVDFSMVENKLDSALDKAGLVVDYNILYLADSTHRDQHRNDRFFTQTVAGHKYSLTIQGYTWYILKNMWFEYLMAFLLIGLITIAFYYILNNLKAQNRLVQIKQDLISNITHELRTPIFTVSAALEALDNFNGLGDPTKTKEYLSISQSELKRLSILVEKVLKTSLLEQDALQLNKEEFDLNQLVSTIANSLKLQLEKQSANLSITLPVTATLIYADKIHLTNVIYNLIDNAMKYHADRPSQIDLSLQTTAQHIQLTISDNGKGIPNVYLDQIFQKFFRVPQGNQHAVKGYGLGLNYVFNIIQKHGGSITVESEEHQGSTFFIKLPK